MEFRSTVGAPKAYCMAWKIEIARRSSRHIMLKKKRRVSNHFIRAAYSGSDRQFDSGNWSIVDANMIVLRKRISELKAQEENYELHADWMQWERNLYPSHQSNVLHSIGWLQFSLINARPSVGLAVVALTTLWLPASVVLAGVAAAGYVREIILTTLQLTSNL